MVMEVDPRWEKYVKRLEEEAWELTKGTISLVGLLSSFPAIEIFFEGPIELSILSFYGNSFKHKWKAWK